jgi:hypothetical protein
MGREGHGLGLRRCPLPKKNLVAVVCHRVGVALDEGPRIRHKNRLTVRALVKVLELFAPGTDLRYLYRTPQATGRYLS